MTQAPASALFFIIGIAMIPLALKVNPPMVGVAAVFLIIGAAGLIRSRRGGGE